MRVRKRWWGVGVRFTHNEICQVVRVTQGLAALAALIGTFSGSPKAAAILWLIAAAIWAHMIWIRWNVGTGGTHLRITWSGNLIRVRQRGSDATCPVF